MTCYLYYLRCDIWYQHYVALPQSAVSRPDRLTHLYIHACQCWRFKGLVRAGDKSPFFAKLIVVIKDCGDRGRRRSAPSMHHFFAACSSLSRDARISSRHLLHQSHLHALQRKLLSCTLSWDYTLLAATHSWWSCELSSVLSLPQIYWLRTLDGTSVRRSCTFLPITH